MKGSVSFEYALLFLAMAGSMAFLLGSLFSSLIYLQHDVKRLYQGKGVLLSLESAGYFVSHWKEANVKTFVLLPQDSNLYTLPLRIEVNLLKEYNGCGDICALYSGSSPFTEDVNITVSGEYRILKNDSGVGIG